MMKSSSIFKCLTESFGAVERSSIKNVNSFRSSRFERESRFGRQDGR